MTKRQWSSQPLGVVTYLMGFIGFLIISSCHCKTMYNKCSLNLNNEADVSLSCLYKILDTQNSKRVRMAGIVYDSVRATMFVSHEQSPDCHQSYLSTH